LRGCPRVDHHDKVGPPGSRGNLPLLLGHASTGAQWFKVGADDHAARKGPSEAAIVKKKNNDWRLTPRMPWRSCHWAGRLGTREETEAADRGGRPQTPPPPKYEPQRRAAWARSAATERDPAVAPVKTASMEAAALVEQPLVAAAVMPAEPTAKADSTTETVSHSMAATRAKSAAPTAATAPTTTGAPTSAVSTNAGAPAKATAITAATPTQAAATSKTAGPTMVGPRSQRVSATTAPTSTSAFVSTLPRKPATTTNTRAATKTAATLAVIPSAPITPIPPVRYARVSPATTRAASLVHPPRPTAARVPISTTDLICPGAPANSDSTLPAVPTAAAVIAASCRPLAARSTLSMVARLAATAPVVCP